MIVLVQAKVLMVGLNGKNEAFRELPVQLIKAESGRQAAQYLKNEKVDLVLCAWNLVDMPDGLFLKKLRIVKPDIRIIVVIKAGDILQEIEARSCGASAVLTDRSDINFFRETVAETVRLTALVANKDCQ